MSWCCHRGDSGADAAVLDLACGTGATTREILRALGPDGTVTGVDKSVAMLAVAASSTGDLRATWIEARGESVDQQVTAPVDAVICNSAVWQTDFAATAMAVRAVTRYVLVSAPIADCFGIPNRYSARNRLS